MMRRAIPTVILLLALAGCAPMPPAGGVQPPPQQGTHGGGTTGSTGEQAPPVETKPQPLHLEGEPSVEVGLATDIDSLQLVATRGTLSWRVGRSHDRARGQLTRMLMLMKGSSLELRGGDGTGPTIASFHTSDTLWIGEPQDGAMTPAIQIFWNNKTWRGQGKVFISPRGRITFALRVPLEAYLIGVVPGEIGGLAPELLEAGRAQAIAARSYTLYYKGRRGSEGFDLYGTVEDQVYGPVESERPLATRCVELTRGRVALYDDAPIRANYYSTCGGITADVWEGFPATGFPYLKSHRDSGGAVDFCAKSPLYRWREEWNVRSFLQTVERYAPAQGVALPAGSLGDLVDVRVVQRSRSGRVWKLEIVTTTGTITVPAYSVRWVLRRPNTQGSILRSTLFKIDVKRDRDTQRAISVVASGAGSGHGVGLCQTGALGMAREKKTDEAILQHYYPGVALRKEY